MDKMTLLEGITEKPWAPHGVSCWPKKKCQVASQAPALSENRRASVFFCAWLPDQRLRKLATVLGALIFESLGPLLQDWLDRNLQPLARSLMSE